MEKLKKIATLKRILTLIVIILVLIFAFQNLNSVSLNLVFFSLDIPLLVFIIALYILGVITGWAVKWNDIKHIVNSAQSETKKELKALQDQIKEND